jgi:hypothetical protein
MKKMDGMGRRDLERLSAYLDGELSQKDTTILEARLQIEPELKEALDELSKTSYALSSLPQVRVPRNFTLTPEMVGIREKHSMYPVFRFATVVAAVAFAVLVGADTFFMRGSWMMADEIMTAPEVFIVQESEVIEALEAPVEKSVEVEAVESPTVEAMDGLDVEGEAFELQPEAPSAVETDEYQESNLGKTEEGPPDRPLNALEATPEDPAEAAEPGERAGSGIEEVPVPSPTPVARPSLEPTEIPVVELRDDQPGISIDPLLAIEIGLGAAALILGGITIYLRKQS